MKTTEILIAEHSEILRGLKKFRQLLEFSFEEKTSEYEEMFDFISEYIDDYHHAKEEEVYFSWLVEKNNLLKNGPVKCMLKEHDEFRALIKKAKDLFYEYIKNKDEAKMLNSKISFLGFIKKLELHINKENEIIYMMAERQDRIHKDGDQVMLPMFEKVNSKYEWIKKKYENITQVE